MCYRFFKRFVETVFSFSFDLFSLTSERFLSPYFLFSERGAIRNYRVYKAPRYTNHPLWDNFAVFRKYGGFRYQLVVFYTAAFPSVLTFFSTLNTFCLSRIAYLPSFLLPRVFGEIKNRLLFSVVSTGITSHSTEFELKTTDVLAKIAQDDLFFWLLFSPKSGLTKVNIYFYKIRINFFWSSKIKI